ncbi:MAG TPA: CocE/NonD family hydrolase [Steroidobacteraceae bacterium]|nr:CocE/NonD family hydrolase [Steroidobacteraceae bacterium]
MHIDSGDSYDGAAALWAASAMPPHLKAVAPCAAPMLDRFNNARFNGVSPTQLIAGFDRLMETLDVKMPALPVDDDKDHVQLDAAIAQHRLSWDNGLASLGAARKARPFHDTPPAHAETNYSSAEGWNYLSNFKVSKIPVLQLAGWRDFTVNQALAWYRSVADQGAVQKIVIGPWYHCEWYRSSLWNTKEEHVRWFDYWLKGKQNGVLSEAAVTYYVAGAPEGTQWRTADRWPLPRQSNRRLYFSDATAGSTRRSLSYSKPSRAGIDNYTVDYEVAGSPLGLPPMPAGQAPPLNPGLVPIHSPALDARSLTYTSPPLDRDVQLTGFPVVVLWVSSDAKDLDFFVDVEEVDEHDTATLLTDGVLRASHAATRDPPYNNEGLPWISDLAADRIELDGTLPRKLEFALNPMSNYIRKGHRLRIAVNNFDKGSGLDTPIITPAPMVRLYRDSVHPSSVTLPFIEGTE